MGDPAAVGPAGWSPAPGHAVRPAPFFPPSPRLQAGLSRAVCLGSGTGRQVAAATRQASAPTAHAHFAPALSPSKRPTAALARATRTASGPRKSWGARRRPSQRASPPGPRSLTRLPGDPCPAGSARGPGAPEGPGPRPPVQLDPQVPRRTGDSRAECVVAGLARRVRAGGSERCLCLGNRIAGADGASAVSVSDRTCPVCEQGSGHCSEATGACSHRPWDPSLLSPPRSASTLLFYFFLVSDFF